MKKIPACVESLISASNQVNSHRKAVEELIYNALDAGATSIAIRINIQENTLQVIDNGSGISNRDLKFVGEKYMTSNFVDLETLKSAPNKYGFCGQSLSNLINVSTTVKVTSRHDQSEETWMKLFEHGKEKQLKICTLRPSKGTTVEIKGLLYNLKIHKKNCFNELQDIKTFMEHVSLVHSNISLSLRDDSRNEIVFKVHKNRDMYQTLSALYNIGKDAIQELQVEKNEYKVTAFLEKSGNETGKDFIFLNGKFIPNTSKLYKIINTSLSKQNKMLGVRKPKAKNYNIYEESGLFQKKISSYFIFIKCPYIDYSLSESSTQSSLEFKDWTQVTKLLDKLVNFFNDDMRLFDNKNEDKVTHKEKSNTYKDTREQVKKIMDKILGPHSRKPGISHMRNGIKGKQIKRKVKKPTIVEAKNVVLEKNCNEQLPATNKVGNIDISADCIVNTNEPNKKEITKRKEINVSEKQPTKNKTKPNFTKSCLGTRIGNIYNAKFIKISTNNEESGANHLKPLNKMLKKKINKTKKSYLKKGDPILRKFEMPTDSVKRRSYDLEKKSRNMPKQLHKRTYEQFVSKNIQFKNVTKNNINVSVRKEIDEIIIHDFNPRGPQNKITDNNCVNSKQFKSNYDLVKTILNSQQFSNIQRHIADKPKSKIIMPKQTQRKANVVYKPAEKKTEFISTEPMLTYQSHNYYAHRNINMENNTYHINHHTNMQIETDDHLNINKKSRKFITKQSRENFMIPNTAIKNDIFKKKGNKTGYDKQLKSSIKRLFNQTSKLYEMKKQIMQNLCESSHTIEFTESSYHVTGHKRLRNLIVSSRNSGVNTEERMNNQEIWSQLVNYDTHSVHNNGHIEINSNTHPVLNIDNNVYTLNSGNWNPYGTYTIEHINEKNIDGDKTDLDINFDDNCKKNNNFIFISKSQEHEQNEQILDPMNVCETVLQSQELVDKEIESIYFQNTQHQQSHNIVLDTNLQRQIDSFNFDIHSCLNEKEHTEDIRQNDGEWINTDNVLQEFSHNFSFLNSDIEINNANKDNQNQSPILNLQQNPTKTEKQQLIKANANVKNLKDSNLGGFNFKNRPGFLPKGMSPIFENCQTKNNCEYNLSEDYYNDEMYNNFVENVRNNAEVFEPNIHEAKEVTTKAIDKVNSKLIKDNSSLKFDGHSLRNAKILGQIDEKFIAGIMKGGCNMESMLDFLVLFDQHAVHERIRLEHNLSDYLRENQWKPVNIDVVTLKISQDDILYLHNYKHKFEQLGLKWTVVNNNEVSFDAIPEAILGKNPRPVDNVIKAVKNLITEEINVIKMQGGCVSLYPKSIMDLVFSEACRYAIKFGEKLSKIECVELLKMLSECKTPFQCAHGRPVMAVIMEIKLNCVGYEVNFNKINKWRALQ